MRSVSAMIGWRRRESERASTGVGAKGESEEDATAVALAVSVAQTLTRLQLHCCCRRRCFDFRVTDEVDGAPDDLVDVLDPAAVVVHLVHGQRDHLPVPSRHSGTQSARVERANRNGQRLSV